MTLSDLYRKVKGICECLSSADVPLKCNGNDFNVDFQVESKDAIVSHIEVKQYLALTLEDIVRLDCIIMSMVGEGYNEGYKTRPFYEEVLRRFNNQRKK